MAGFGSTFLKGGKKIEKVKGSKSEGTIIRRIYSEEC
jgi:hypothetical protein